MKKALFTILLSFVTLCATAQINFEEGYFINSEGERIDCLIKNRGWLNNPTTFEYKTTEESEVATGTVSNTLEFVVGQYKFVKVNAQIDRTTEKIQDINFEREPEFSSETLFLRVLVEGASTLYYFEDNLNRRFFWKNGDSEISQLIYKRYRTTQSTIEINKKYKEQLWSALQCEGINLADIRKVKHDKKDLINIFKKFSECKGIEYVSFDRKSKIKLTGGESFKIRLKPGYTLNRFDVEGGTTTTGNTDFNNSSLRFGVEFELLLPINKGIWALVFEPNFKSFKVTKQLSGREATLDFNAVEFPLSLRRYFYLGENSKILIDGTVLMEAPRNSRITHEFTATKELRSSFGLALGAGYLYKDRFGIMARLDFGKNPLHHFKAWYVDYKTISLMFSYKVF